MSVRVLSWVLDHSEAPGNDRLVLIAIADEADDDGANAYPSIDRIARRARVNKRTTMRALERLEATGELVVLRPEVNGRGHHNRYAVVMGRPIDEVAGLVAGSRKGDTLASTKNGAERRGRARNGAPMSAPDPQTSGLIDTEDHNPARVETLELVIDEAATTASFDEFWLVYPRRDGKPAARTAWATATKSTPPAAILAGLERWVAYWEARNQPEFTPWAQKWLRQEQWNATPPAIRQQPQTGQRAPVVADRSRPSGEVAL
jgi:hypothetical protein